MGRTIWGVVGLGAFGWDKIEVPDNRRILITTRSHSNKLVTSCLDNMKPTQVERQGGAGNKVKYLKIKTLLSTNNFFIDFLSYKYKI